MYFSGFGGQGIMLLGQVVAYAGMLEGKEVTFLPSYGPEMRGGTANCTVILSEEPISCPIVDKASILVAMNLPSLLKFENQVVAGGHIFINSSMIKQKVKRHDLMVHEVDATEIAKSIGNERTANMVMLGSINNLLGIVQKESLETALAKVFGESKTRLIDINKHALAAWKKQISLIRGGN
jgi:2-oxoglutarate ferredoxin oxidoreductase subunit gamma